MYTLESKVKTRDGRKARIIAVDRKHGSYPVIALVMGDTVVEVAYYYYSNGRFFADGLESPLDLIPDTTEVWYFNVFEGTGFSSLEEVLKHSGTASTGAFKLTFDGGKLISAEVVEDDNGN